MNPIEKPLAEPRTLTFSVALEPYLDAHGRTRASYQTLNADGYALAVCHVCDGKISHSAVRFPVDAGTFFSRALCHFCETKPQAFGVLAEAHAYGWGSQSVQPSTP